MSVATRAAVTATRAAVTATRTELAVRLSLAILAASNPTNKHRAWTPQHEQALQKLGLRESLSPTLVARVIDPYLLNYHSLALGFFNWASQQPNYTHSSPAFESVFRSLSLSRQVNAFEFLFKQVKALNLTLSSSTYGIIIRALVKGRKTLSAFSVFDEVKSKSLDLDADICNLLLGALGSGECYNSALKLFEEMCSRNVRFSTMGFGVFVWRFCGKADLGKVLSYLDEAVKTGSSEVNGSIVALLIVHGLCKESRFGEAKWVLNELRVRCCKPDFMAYRVVAEGFSSIGSAADVNEVLKMKRKLGVAPRSSDYMEFILELIKEQYMLEAKELGEIIVDGNFPIEDDVLDALIDSVSRDDPCSALVFFNYLIGLGKLPTLSTFSNLSNNMIKHDKIDDLLVLYRVLYSKDFFCDTESYNLMFTFLCKAGRVREAYAVLQEMRKKGFGLYVLAYNCLMEACCKDDLLRPAKKLWDEMFVYGCGVNLQTYNILISKFSEISECDEALRLFNHMLEKGFVPDATTYTSLIEGLCQDSKYEDAIQIFDKCVEQDVMLAKSLVCVLITNLCRKGEFIRASNLLLSRSSSLADSESHVILLKCIADANGFPIAIEHAKRLQEKSSSLLQVLCIDLLATASTSSNPQPILQLIQAIS